MADQTNADDLLRRASEGVLETAQIDLEGALKDVDGAIIALDIDRRRRMPEDGVEVELRRIRQDLKDVIETIENSRDTNGDD